MAVLLMASSGWAQVSVKAVLEPSEIPFYERSYFRIEIEAPADLKVELPDLRPAFESMQLMTEESSVANYLKEPLRNNRVRITETYSLDPVFVREYFFEAITVSLSTGETIVIPAPTLRVRDLTDAEQEAIEQFDAEIVGGPDAAGRPLSGRWEFWVVIAAIAMAMLLGYWFVTYRQLKLIEPERDPWEVALARLKALSERNLAKQGKFGVYYVDLSSILRYYVEGRFDLHAPERTTPEFLAEMMETNQFTKEQEVFLREFLRLCDRVKFAKHLPGIIDVEEHFVGVRAFIEETIPRDEEVPEDAAA
jgi:hypothetical protein